MRRLASRDHRSTALTALLTAALAAAPVIAGEAPVFYESQKLLPSDSGWRDYFGVSVAVSGSRMVIGADGHRHDGEGDGAAYIFERDADGRWVEIAELRASDRGDDDQRQFDHFGYGVAIDGDTVVVGAYGDDDPTGSGSVYVYERDESGAWFEAAKLRAFEGSALTADDIFGFAVAVRGDTLVVGAPTDSGLAFEAGAAYVYRRDPEGNWMPVQKLLASDGEIVDRFGWAIALEPGRLVVTSELYALRPHSSADGGAYVFEPDGDGSWSEVARLTPADGRAGDGFGVSVALSGDTIAVGANGIVADLPGRVHVFERDPGLGWVETALIEAADGFVDNGFGDGVALSGDLLAVGAYRDTDPIDVAGAAYLFVRDGSGTWSERAKLRASDADSYDGFGEAVAIGGSSVFVGARSDGGFWDVDDHGALYVYTPE